MTTPADFASPAVDESSPRYDGWRVTAVCFVVAMFCWGFGLYSHGIYLAELQRLFGWSTSLISGATTAYYLLTASLVVFISDAIVQLGPRRVFLLGTCCLGSAVTLLAFIVAPWQLYLVYLIIAVAETGFAAAMVGAATVMAAILVPAITIWIDQPPIRTETTGVSAPQGGSRSGSASTVPRCTRLEALQSLAFWSVAGPFALALMAQVGFFVHQIAFLEPAIGRTQAGLTVALLTAMAIVGRLALGASVLRLDLRRVTALSAMTQTTNAAVLFVACAIFGLSAGNLVSLPALIIQREFEATSFGMLVGLST